MKDRNEREEKESTSSYEYLLLFMNVQTQQQQHCHARTRTHSRDITMTTCARVSEIGADMMTDWARIGITRDMKSHKIKMIATESRFHRDPRC